MTSNYVSNTSNNYSYNGGNVNNTVSYYPKSTKIYPRSKTNSRKRGTVVLKGKDSRNPPSAINPGGIRPNKTNIKKVPLNYVNQSGRTKSTNNRSNLKERLKTIEYKDSNFRSLVSRSNTAQRRRRLNVQNNFSSNDNYPKPYSNFIPSTNTRSNITIDRSGSLGYGKVGIKDPSSISNITNTKTNSNKFIVPINEYEDDSVITLNSHSYVKNKYMNTTMGAKSSNESVFETRHLKGKIGAKEVIKKPKFNKVTKKEIRSKSNKRVQQKGNFERIYLQSPPKFYKNGHSQVRLRKNISNNESEGSLKNNINLRDNTVSPAMPMMSVVAEKERHKTTGKERPVQKFNNSMKHEVSSIDTSKDHSRLNFAKIKHAVSIFKNNE